MELIIKNLFLSLVGTINAVANCQFKSATSGDNYDFSSLANSTEYSYADIKASATYFFNFCKTSATCVQQGGVTDSSACQKNSNGLTNCGLIGTQTFTELAGGAQGANMTYFKGSVCGNGRPRQLSLVCSCDLTADPIKFSKIEEPVSCMYNIYCSSKYACPGAAAPSTGSGGGKGIGGGWIFIIVLVVCTVLYLAGGVTYNHKIRGLTGKEMIPNYAFWSDFPGLLKDGIFFIKGKITGTGSSYRGYQQV
ncbi:hypothetical protein PPL_11204 [Heterostelium album PN500]|uniref:Autophagy-related protein 27 n=1 Tax=Heterostelium pallidum (strain ATCC 26659 / Pp 5 / PN500) TaxID=670386 RepID=D3BTU4_HETP5|nr:hypothetical protein PPL_11204 [Heterostelium album PN500]EFA75130.1 hypothetical protein PPL_11204 [Heterostelium album PN500]|eukprot:XP_020427264.1 hypothetical protein PPL_11204 [Heterostelium album PN500]